MLTAVIGGRRTENHSPRSLWQSGLAARLPERNTEGILRQTIRCSHFCYCNQEQTVRLKTQSKQVKVHECKNYSKPVNVCPRIFISYIIVVSWIFTTDCLPSAPDLSWWRYWKTGSKHLLALGLPIPSPRILTKHREQDHLLIQSVFLSYYSELCTNHTGILLMPQRDKSHHLGTAS